MKLSVFGSIVAAIAFIGFSILLTRLLDSTAFGVVLGLLMAIFACRPIKDGGKWLFQSVERPKGEA
jgi:hypothetical protein